MESEMEKPSYKTDKRGERASSTISFLCPQCMKGTIVRSQSERKIGTKYLCKDCGFTGPH